MVRNRRNPSKADVPAASREFGKALRAYRLSLGKKRGRRMSQGEFGAMCCLDPRTAQKVISDMELGKSTRFSYANAVLIKRAVGNALPWHLLEGDSDWTLTEAILDWRDQRSFRPLGSGDEWRVFRVGDIPELLADGKPIEVREDGRCYVLAPGKVSGTFTVIKRKEA